MKLRVSSDAKILEDWFVHYENEETDVAMIVESYSHKINFDFSILGSDKKGDDHIPNWAAARLVGTDLNNFHGSVFKNTFQQSRNYPIMACAKSACFDVCKRIYIDVSPRPLFHSVVRELRLVTSEKNHALNLTQIQVTVGCPTKNLIIEVDFGDGTPPENAILTSDISEIFEKRCTSLSEYSYSSSHNYSKSGIYAVTAVARDVNWRDEDMRKSVELEVICPFELKISGGGPSKSHATAYFRSSVFI